MDRARARAVGRGQGVQDPRHRLKHRTSGFNVGVSDASWCDLEAQAGDACAFIATHEAELLALRAMSEVEDMVLDFPVEQRDVFAQSERLPASLVTAAGRIGLDLEISIYPCSGHQEGEGSGVGDPVTAADAERMALSWLELQRHRWAWEAVDDLVSDHPAAALLALDAMVAHAGSDAVVDEVGAGPLQDLVRAHAGVLIDELEERAAASPGWRRAFGRVWVPHRDDALTERLEALGCIRRDRRKIHDEATRGV